MRIVDLDIDDPGYDQEVRAEWLNTWVASVAAGEEMRRALHDGAALDGCFLVFDSDGALLAAEVFTPKALH